MLNTAIVICKTYMHGEHVVEDKIYDFTNLYDLNKHASIENISFGDGSAFLRSKSGKNSLIRISDDHKENNWSAVMTILPPKPKDLESEYILLWYTTKPVEKGNFLGMNSIFSGLVVGLEFTEHTSSIVFSYNIGMDYGNDHYNGIRRDILDRSKIKDNKKLVMKVIHTEQNFKVEIYSDGNLISDSFVVASSMLLNGENTKTYFSISSYYGENTKETNRGIELYSFGVNKRTELEDYNMLEHHSEYNGFKENKSEITVKDAVANSVFFLRYLTVVFGGDGKNSFKDMEIRTKEKLMDVRTKLQSIIIRRILEKKNKDKDVQKEKERKIDNLRDVVEQLEFKIGKIGDMFLNIPEKQNKVRDIAINMFFMVAMGSMMVVVLRMFSSKAYKSINNKHEFSSMAPSLKTK